MSAIDVAKSLCPADQALLLIISVLLEVAPDQKALLSRLTEIAAEPWVSDFARELLAMVRADVRRKADPTQQEAA